MFRRRRAVIGSRAPAPVISAVSYTDNADGTATVTWTTDIASTTVVDYGATTSYGSQASNSTPVTSHSISVPSGAGVWRYRPASVANGQTTTGTDAELRVTNVFMTDNFTGGASGDDLTAHTPDSGGTWQRSPTNATQAVQMTGAGTVRADSNSGARYYVAADQPSLYCQIDLQIDNKSANTTAYWGAVFQRLANTTTGANKDAWVNALIASNLARLDNAVKSSVAQQTGWTYSSGATIYGRLLYDGAWRLYKSTDGTNYTEVTGGGWPLKRNDLVPSNIGDASLAWGGKGKVGIMLYGAATDSTYSHASKITAKQINPDSAKKLVIFDGNSIVRGVGTNGGSGSGNYWTTCWPQRWLDLQTDSNAVIANLGIQAQTTPQMTTNSPAKVQALAERGLNKVIIFVHEAGNNIVTNGASAATAYANLNSYKAAVAAALPAGVTPIWIISKVLPRITAGFNTTKDAVNALIDANAIADGWNYIFTPSDAMLLNANNPSGGPSGTNYYDGIHPNDAGAAILAADLKSLTDTIL